MKFYVLVSNYPSAFERCLQPLPWQDTVVVINTSVEGMEQRLADMCDKRGIPYHITESNGTPGKGKNALVKVFLESDDDYMVMIDGDDFLTPHGVRYFQNLDYKPDMLCTYGDIKSYDADYILSKLTQDPHLSLIDTKYWDLYPDDQDYSIMAEDVANTLYKDPRFSYDEAVEVGYAYSDFHEYMKDFADKGTGLLRLLMWSKKAARHANYNETLFIGDDHIQYFDFKCLAYTGELDMQIVKHDEKPLYMYVIDNENSPGVCYENHFGDMRWTRPLMHILDARNDILGFKLPFYEDSTQR